MSIKYTNIIYSINNFFFFLSKCTTGKSYLEPIIAGFIVYMSMYLLVRQFEMGMFIELIVGSAVFVLLFFGLVWLFKLDKKDKYILEISFGKLRKSKT